MPLHLALENTPVTVFVQHKKGEINITLTCPFHVLIMAAARDGSCGFSSDMLCSGPKPHKRDLTRSAHLHCDVDLM